MFRRSTGVRMSTDPPVRLGVSPLTSSKISRLSSVAASASGQQRNLSRLPLPQQGKRSTSMGPRERSLNRNPLSAITPQQNSNRKSRSVERNDQFTTPMRMPSNRKANRSSERQAPLSVARLSGRGSNIGVKTVKDSRPLNDKQYQQTQIRKILDFLRENDYPNKSLTSKNFPLSAKEFADVFNFLYKIIDPENPEAIPYSRGEDAIVKLMKELCYPGSLTKSNFLTMGSLHSWPTVLGCLAYLCDIARLHTKSAGSLLSMAFPSKDENGFPSNKESPDLLQLRTTIKCYDGFNQGDDNYEEFYEGYRCELMRIEEVDQGQLNNLQAQAAQLHNKVDALKKKPSKEKEMTDKLESARKDLEKMQSYLASLHQKTEELEKKSKMSTISVERELDKLRTKEQDMLAFMETFNRERVSEMDMERNAVQEAELKRKLEVKKENLANQDKEIWQRELQANRKYEEVENICKQFNKVWFQENLATGQEPLFLPPPVIREGVLQAEPGLAAVCTDLAERLREYRAGLRNEEREHADKTKTVQAGKEANQARTEQAESLKARLGSIQIEAAQQREQAEREEAALDRTINMLRNQITEIRSGGGSKQQLQERKLQLEAEIKKLEEFRLARQLKYRDFLRKVKETHKEYVEDLEAGKQGAMLNIQSQCEARKRVLGQKTEQLRESREKQAKLEQKEALALAKLKKEPTDN